MFRNLSKLICVMLLFLFGDATAGGEDEIKNEDDCDYDYYGTHT